MNNCADENQQLSGKPPYAKSAVDREGKQWRDGLPHDAGVIEAFLEFNSVLLSDLLAIAEETAGSLLLPLKPGAAPVVLPNSDTYVFSARVKTEETLLQKLRRMRKTPLRNVQDVAGLRFDCSLTLSQQTKVAEAFSNAFLVAGASRVDIRDLREGSHSGYRAVHLHIRSSLGRAEMQIRSSLQSKWANLYEEAADIYGRDIRYLHEAGVSMPAGAEKIVQDLHALSNRVKEVEELVDNGLPSAESDISTLEPDLYGTLDSIHKSLRANRLKATDRSRG